MTPTVYIETTIIAMKDDPIIEEIRSVRQEHTDRFNGDLHAICEDLRRQERESRRRHVSLTPRRVKMVAVGIGVKGLE